MAQRRMFSLKVVDTDAFLEMPISSQALYFHLAMRADDDGFVSNPKKILRMLGGQEDDYKVLAGKRFIVPFQSGVCVIKHWLIHNLIRGDRYTPTQWIDEKNALEVDEETQKYSLIKGENDVIPDGNQMAPQVRLGKVRLGKVSGSTPADIARSFFEGGEHLEKIKSEFSSVPSHVLDGELQKFSLYWTEPNKSGTRVRWEQQETFDVKRRLVTWLSRTQQDYKREASKGRGFVE